MTKQELKKWKPICKILTENIERTWGKAWKSLGEPLQYALIAEQVLHTFTGRPDEYPVKPSQIHQYLQAMWTYHNLLQPDEPEEQNHQQPHNNECPLCSTYPTQDCPCHEQ